MAMFFRNGGKRRPRFCAKTRKPMPKGYVKDPSTGDWMSGDQIRELAGDAAAIGVDGWRRGHAVLAQRVDAAVIEEIGGEMPVKTGTAVVVVRDGGIGETLFEGRLSLAELVKSGDPARELVFMNLSSVGLPLDFDGLLSRDGHKVDLQSEIEIAFAGERVREFLTKSFPDLYAMDGREAVGKVVFTLDSVVQLIEKQVYAKLRGAAEEFVGGRTVEDLISSADARLEMEDLFIDILQESLNALGFDLLQVAELRFFGKAYKKSLEAAGDLEAKRREMEIFEKVRRAKAEFERSEKQEVWDQEKFLAKLAQERELSEVEQKRARRLTELAFAKEIAEAEQTGAFEEERRKLGHELELERTRRHKRIEGELEELRAKVHKTRYREQANQIAHEAETERDRVDLETFRVFQEMQADVHERYTRLDMERVARLSAPNETLMNRMLEACEKNPQTIETIFPKMIDEMRKLYQMRIEAHQSGQLGPQSAFFDAKIKKVFDSTLGEIEDEQQSS